MEHWLLCKDHVLNSQQLYDYLNKGCVRLGPQISSHGGRKGVTEPISEDLYMVNIH